MEEWVKENLKKEIICVPSTCSGPLPGKWKKRKTNRKHRNRVTSAFSNVLFVSCRRCFPGKSKTQHLQIDGEAGR